MIQQEYTVRPPRGIGYRIVVEIRDEPIVASRGSRTLSLDAAWVNQSTAAFLARNKDYSGIVPYFAGFLKGLNAIGVLDVVETIPIPSEVPPRPPEPEEQREVAPQPLWAAWKQVGS